MLVYPETFARFTTDNPADLLAIVAARKIRIDQMHRTELMRWYENPGLRIRYFAKDRGLTIDGLGEAWLDAGLLQESPSERDVLDILEIIFSAVTGRASAATIETQANTDGREREKELRHARSNRQRAWNCPCGQSLIRAARLTLQLRCEACDGRVVRMERTVAEIVLNVPLSAIQGPDYRPVDLTDVPF